MKLIAVLTVVLAMVVPTAAYAQDAGEGYSNVAGAGAGGGGNGVESGAAGGSGGGGDAAPASQISNQQSGGGLPVTGLDLGVVLAGGLLLVGAGLVLRRTRLN